MLKDGFTLIEMMITIGVIGILAAISIPVYQDYIVKTQVSEALRLAYGLKTSILLNNQDGTCFDKMATTASTRIGVDSMNGKYGTAIITSAANGLPPCGIKYMFKSNNISGNVADKVIVMKVGDNGILINAAATDVDVKYLPQSIR